MKRSYKLDLWQRFLHTGEGSLFYFGCIMLLCWGMAIILLWRSYPRHCYNLLLMVATHFAGGRASSIAYGVTALPNWLVAFQALYTDVAFLFLIYPTLIFCYRYYSEKRFFRQRMQPFFDTARRSLSFLGRFKTLGVFLFVWCPLWMTGMLVGSILGFLIGLKTWVNMMTVILGSVFSVISYIFLYAQLFQWLEGFHSGLPILVVIAIVAVAILMRFVKRLRKK